MQNQYLQVRLNLVLSHMQHKQSFPADMQEIEKIAKYIVDGPTIQPIHGTLVGV